MPAREEWDPIQAEESLTAAFQGTAVSGQWVLRLRDTTVKELNDGIDSGAIWDAHGDGGVAGWEASDALSRGFWRREEGIMWRVHFFRC